MRACALSVPSSGHTRCVFRHVCQSFRVCVFVTRESRASKGKDDSPAPPLPLRCCAFSSSYLPSSPFPAPRAFWDAAYHPTQSEFFAAFPPKGASSQAGFRLSFLFFNPPPDTRAHRHTPSDTHTHTQRHTPALCVCIPGNQSEGSALCICSKPKTSPPRSGLTGLRR